MAARLPQIEQLPRRNATEVKNRWGDLVREVRANGSVAVTHHDKVEMVVVEAAQYRAMAALVDGIDGRRQAALADLAAEFDRHLAALKAPDARQRVEATMASRGRVTPRPKAGASF
jgi:antitoxin (DNA-binding transcriptional repressor) of toxin-antitoxin stability system